MKYISPCLVLVLLLLSTGCEGVNPFLLGAPCAITTNANPDICVKDIGFDPPTCEEGFTPDFAKAVRDWLAIETGPSPILAMSMGTDVIHAYETTLDPGTIVDGSPLLEQLKVAAAYLPSDSHGWMAIGFTVNSAQVDAVDLVPDSDIKVAFDAGELDRTIFNYMIEGSDVYPADLTVGESQKILSAADLGLNPGDEIQGLNLNMAMYHSDLDYASFFDPPRPLPANPKIYFTLKQPGVAPAWFKYYEGGTDQVPAAHNQPSSGTILVSSWNGTKWSQPEVYKTWYDLKLHDDTVVIDGLSIDIDEDIGEEEILFSTENAEPEDQMLYFRVGSSDAPRRFVIMTKTDPVTLKEQYGSGGRRIGSSRGLGDFCTEDPFVSKDQSATNEVQLDDFFIARRHKPLVPGELRLGVSGFRRKEGGRVYMRSCMEFRCRPSKPLEATAQWTHADYDGITLGLLNWMKAGSGSKVFPGWTGKHLTVDAPFPPDVWTTASKSPWTPFGTKAMVVRWVVRDGGQVIAIGPLSVLRF